MVEIEVAVDVGGSVTVAVKHAQILLAGQVEPIDHAFLEQCVEVGGVITGIAGDLVFPRVVPIGAHKKKMAEDGRFSVLGSSGRRMSSSSANVGRVTSSGRAYRSGK